MRRDGTYVTRLSPVAINYRGRGGRWRPIDNNLVRAGAADRARGFASQNAANSYRALLPQNLSKPVLVRGSGSWVSFRLAKADAAARAAKNEASFKGALAGVDVGYAATNGGLKETMTLAGPDSVSRFDYRVHASRDLRARSDRSGGVEFVNRRGAVVFSFAAPFVYDHAQGSHNPSYRNVSLRLRRTHGGYRVRLKVRRSWLRSKKRSFPVTVDPSVYHWTNDTDARLRHTGANLDCYFKDGASATTNYCAATELHVGWDGATQRRAALRFDVQNSLPKGIRVLDADFGMNLLAEDNASTSTLNLHRITRSWTSGATWNSFDGTSPWTSAGGDYDSSVAAANTVGGNPGQWYLWHPRQLVQGWVDGSIPNYGLLVKQATERSLVNRYQFWSSEADPSVLPYIDVVYEPQTGQRPYYKYDGQKLSDRMDLGVNVASGNLLIHNSDMQMNGTGVDLSLDRYFNSQLQRDTGFGHEGWTFGTGADVSLRLTSDSAIFHAPSGYVVSFQKNADGSYSTPKGFDATLCTVGTAGCSGPSAYALTFNHTQHKFNFNSTGKLASDEDQNHNRISYAYDGSGKLASITDTQNRVTNVAYNGTGLISQVTDPTGRTNAYGYDSSKRLTSYTDANGKTTSYAYPGGSAEPTQITDPAGKVTKIGYDTTPLKRVTSVTRVTDTAAGTGPTTSYSYGSPTGPCDASKHYGKTVVTDANNHATTNCYDSDGKVLDVYDAKGNHQSTGYSSSSFVNSYTAASNQTAGFNTSVTRDSVSNSVTATKQPTGTSSSLNTSAGYDQTSSAPYAPYYPKTTTNPQGHSQSAGYDSFGNISDVTDSDSPSNHTHADYDPNHPGRLTKSTDANGHATSYGYDAQGNLTSITPPAPLGATRITYDSANRVRTVTDGKNQTRTYGYDSMDRNTSIAFSDGSGLTNVYDEDGNLTSRTDTGSSSSQTTYTYDALNRVKTQVFPDGKQNAYTYDGAGNLLTLTDAGGTVTYAYDERNVLTSIAQPGGNCAATPAVRCVKYPSSDEDGQHKTIALPNGVTITRRYDKAGRVSYVDAKNGAGTVLRSLDYKTMPSGATMNDSGVFQSVTDQAGNVTSYGYDSLDRLKAATTKNSGGTVTDEYSYGYDPTGNMTTKSAKANSGSTSTSSLAYNDANELCWSASGSVSGPACASPPAGASTYSYDANGNQTAKSDGRAYSYNAKDQTTSVTPAGGAAQALSYRGPNQVELAQRAADKYGNNVLGVGYKVHSDANTSYYTRDEEGTLVAERAPGGSDYYYLQDALGSVIAMTDPSAGVANSYKYDPYGDIVSQTETTPYANLFRFAGGLYSSTLGLHKFGMRWYDQKLGRWTQQDPIDQTGDLQQGNRYQYAGVNPINQADPSGLFSIGIDVQVEAGPVRFSGGVSVDHRGHVGVSSGAGGGEGAGGGVQGYVNPSGRVRNEGDIVGGGCVGGELSACYSAHSRGGASAGIGTGDEAGISYQRTRRIW